MATKTTTENYKSTIPLRNRIVAERYWHTWNIETSAFNYLNKSQRIKSKTYQKKKKLPEQKKHLTFNRKTIMCLIISNWNKLLAQDRIDSRMTWLIKEIIKSSINFLKCCHIEVMKGTSLSSQLSLIVWQLLAVLQTVACLS